MVSGPTFESNALILFVNNFIYNYRALSYSVYSPIKVDVDICNIAVLFDLYDTITTRDQYIYRKIYRYVFNYYI